MEPTAPAAPELKIHASPGFTAWLAEQRASLAFTTYQTGKLFLVGRDDEGRLSVFERTFSRCMGLHATDQTLHVGTQFQLWRFENALAPGELYEGYDRLYVPRLAWTTGDLDAHDIAVESSGRIVFVNTAFGCLATVSERYNFVPLWRPPFLSALAGEDRCHLNGVAVRDGVARYATCASRDDVKDGWREHRRDGGTVLDVTSGADVLSGLSMPHSPRWWRDRLWLHDSGSGHFGHADEPRGRFVPVAWCPGYLRGLAFTGRYAVAGLSLPRANKTFGELALDAALRKRGAEAVCGLQVIDLDAGRVAQWLRIQGLVEELYDVAVLPGVQRPMALGFKTDEIERFVTIGPAAAG